MKNAAEGYINTENMGDFSFTNTGKLKSLRGIIMSFHGKGFTGTMDHNAFTDRLAEMGIAYITPYYGPWAWMNPSALALTEALIDAVYSAFGINEPLPMVSSGSSMGGINALLFAIFSKRPLSAVALDCPVSEQVEHYSEDYYMSKTILPCFAEMPPRATAQEFFADWCPLAMADRLPDVPYLFVHGLSDTNVLKAKHSDRLVKALRDRGRNVKYVEVPGMEHCAMPSGVAADFQQFMIDSVIGKDK